MAETIDLKKKAQAEFISLKKKAKESVALAGLGGQIAQVVTVLDISISMRGLFGNGTVQAICERGLALGVQFDDDGEIPVYPFGVQAHPARRLVEDDFYGFIDREITSKMSLEGGTRYANPLELVIADHFPEIQRTVQQKRSGGFFGFGASVKNIPGDFERVPVTDNPVFVQFITDGENQDEARAEEIIRAAATLPMFIQFIGIGNASFRFLKQLDDMSGRFIDNAGFCHIENVQNTSDEDFLAAMLNEFPDYIKEARRKGLVV
ncbi:VWA domain-containing protein [Patescibacteria group bacterium]